MKFDKEISDKVAASLLGMKFKMGARGENNEIDCYGIIAQYYKAFGVTMPDYAIEENWDCKEELYLEHYASMMRKLDPAEAPKIGDMVLFINDVEAPNHAGIYLGDGMFIHAYKKIGVKIDSLVKNKLWKNKVYGYFRIKKWEIKNFEI